MFRQVLERYQLWIYLTVLGAGAIALHLLMNAKVGGAPLLLSMLRWQFREQDSPGLWPAHVSRWWSGVQQGAWTRWFQPVTAMTALEIAILVSIVAAWIIPLLK
jgi:hypothetical protein